MRRETIPMLGIETQPQAPSPSLYRRRRIIGIHVTVFGYRVTDWSLGSGLLRRSDCSLHVIVLC
jgi:hypothetical protein